MGAGRRAGSASARLTLAPHSFIAASFAGLMLPRGLSVSTLTSTWLRRPSHSGALMNCGLFRKAGSTVRAASSLPGHEASVLAGEERNDVRDASYWPTRRTGICAAMLDTLTMRPPAMSLNGRLRRMPALLTSTERRPEFGGYMLDSLLDLVLYRDIRPHGNSGITARLDVVGSFSGPPSATLSTATAIPSASQSAVAAPMPLAAPVTIAIRSSWFRHVMSGGEWGCKMGRA